MTPEDVRQVTDGVQWFLFGGAVVMAALLLVIILRFKTRAALAYTIGLLTYALHSALFYGFAALNLIPSPWGNFWSSLLRLHINLYLLGTIIIFIVAYRRGGYRSTVEEGRG